MFSAGGCINKRYYMKIYLYTLNKRENSTQRPAGTGREFDCVLKDTTSIVDPVILINYKDQDNPQPHIYNYAYIPTFNRYYFIADIKSENGIMWEYHLTCDILATYKGVISASTLYLLRCSTLYDGDVVDNYYPLKTSYTTDVKTTATPWLHEGTADVNKSLGCYILGIVAKPFTTGASFVGSIKYIVVDQTNLMSILDYLLDAGNLTSGNVTISGMSDEAIKSIIDPLSFIKSCQWCPLMYSQFDTTEYTGLTIWSWTISGVKFKAVPVNPAYVKQSASFPTIPRHPQAASRGAYLNTAPYTAQYLHIPPFGVIELDTTLMAKSSQLIGQIIYDLVTGEAILNVHYGTASGPAPIHLKSQVGVPIQLTQVYNDYINAAGGVAGGVVGTIGSVLTGNIAGAITGAMGAIGSAANAVRPVQSNLGGNGGFSDLYGYAKLTSIFYDVPDEDRAHVGRPLCQAVTISTLASGTYCLAMDGDVPISGTAGEQQQLKAYLEGGFFYE